MKTIILVKPGEFRLTDTDPPDGRGPGQALVRVRRIGICGTDMHAFRGRQPYLSYPRILGHELGVEVVEVDSNDRGIAVGDQCAVEPYSNCGRCIACRNDKPNCCTSLQCLGVQTDGGMREWIVVPANKLHKSELLSLEQLALIETLGIGHHAVGRAQPRPRENVLVVGAGPIGLSVIQFAKVAGAEIAVLDINDQRLEFCRGQFGIQRTILPGDDPVAQIRDAFGGELPTAVFDATGSSQSMEAAFGYVANGGRLIYAGLAQADIRFNDPEFHRREITLFASRNSTPDDFQRIIQLVEQGIVDTGPWITHHASMETMIGQFEDWLLPETGVIKAMVAC